MNQPAAGPAGPVTPLDPPATTAPVPVDPLAGRKDWAAISLLLVGGLFGVLQTTLKWFDSDDGSWVTGWGWYYNTVATGIGSIGASYAIMICALAGVVMLLVGVALIMRPTARRVLGTIGL